MLTAVVLTKNSASRLSDCLASLHFCDAIAVVDDASQDDTQKIAKKYHATVLNHALGDDYSAQRNFALSQIKSHWILFVDSDEVVSEPLRREIVESVAKVEYKGFFIQRVDYLWGTRLNHGDVGQVYLLRLGRNGAGTWQGRVHERWQISGRMGKLKGQINHYPHSSFVEFIKKINSYSTIRASELYDQKCTANIVEIVFMPVGKFLHLYLIKLGILDGTEGFIHAMTMAFYTFLVRGKLYLLGKGIPNTNV